MGQVAFARTLARWGHDVEGDWRAIPGAALVGAVVFLLLWGLAVQAFGGAGDLPAASVAAGVLAFAALWSTFGFLAMSGWSRVAYAAVVGHVVGLVVLAANLVAAAADAVDPTFAVTALFGITGLGVLAGLPLEWLARRAGET